MASLDHFFSLPSAEVWGGLLAGNRDRPFGDAFNRQCKHPGCNRISCTEVSIV